MKTQYHYELWVTDEEGVPWYNIAGSTSLGRINQYVEEMLKENEPYEIQKVTREVILRGTAL